ncbi:hypothetical protein H6G32_19265 [Cylindrospermum sp. FACHB-282]|nr:hypothetical protein [Cylindrospermum sp. FACHB-282]
MQKKGNFDTVSATAPLESQGFWSKTWYNAFPIFEKHTDLLPVSISAADKEYLLSAPRLICGMYF